MSSTWITSRVDASGYGCLTDSEVPGATAIGLTGMKVRWWSLSLFSTAAQYTRIFKCPYRYKSKGFSLTRYWVLPWKPFACLYWFELFSLFWCGELWNLSRHLNTPCINIVWISFVVRRQIVNGNYTMQRFNNLMSV